MHVAHAADAIAPPVPSSNGTAISSRAGGFDDVLRDLAPARPEVERDRPADTDRAERHSSRDTRSDRDNGGHDSANDRAASSEAAEDTAAADGQPADSRNNGSRNGGEEATAGEDAADPATRASGEAANTEATNNEAAEVDDAGTETTFDVLAMAMLAANPDGKAATTPNQTNVPGDARPVVPGSVATPTGPVTPFGTDPSVTPVTNGPGIAGKNTVEPATGVGTTASAASPTGVAAPAAATANAAAHAGKPGASAAAQQAAAPDEAIATTAQPTAKPAVNATAVSASATATAGTGDAAVAAANAAQANANQSAAADGRNGPATAKRRAAAAALDSKTAQAGDAPFERLHFARQALAQAAERGLHQAAPVAADARPATPADPTTQFTATNSVTNGGDATAAKTQAATASRAAPQPHAQTVAQRIGVTIARVAETGADRMTLRLNPSSMGRIDVQLDMASDGKLTAVLSVEKPETLDQLQRSARDLEQALRDAGVSTDSGSLNFGLKDQEAATHDQLNNAGNDGPGRQGPDDDEIETELEIAGDEAWLRGGRTADGRTVVDVYV